MGFYIHLIKLLFSFQETETLRKIDFVFFQIVG